MLDAKNVCLSDMTKGSPAYIVYFTDSRMFKRVRCVKFTDDFDGVIEMSDPVRELQPLQIPVLDDETVQENVSSEPVCAVDRRYPQRERTQPRYLDDYEVETDYDLAGRANNIDYCYRVADVPRSYTNAISSLESDKLYSATNEDMTALQDNLTFEITPLPDGKTVLGGGKRWLYAVKLGEMVRKNTKLDYLLKDMHKFKM